MNLTCTNEVCKSSIEFVLPQPQLINGLYFSALVWPSVVKDCPACQATHRITINGVKHEETVGLIRVAKQDKQESKLLLPS